MAENSKSITIVCTGNTCRSPMAERLLKHALQAETSALATYRVQSAGISAYAGDAPSPNSVTALKKVGLDLSDHRSRPLSEWMLQDSDLVLVMADHHKDHIQSIFPDIQTPIFLFRQWLDHPQKNVPDPYGGNLEKYLETRDALVEAIPSIIAFLKKDL